MAAPDRCCWPRRWRQHTHRPPTALLPFLLLLLLLVLLPPAASTLPAAAKAGRRRHHGPPAAPRPTAGAATAFLSPFSLLRQHPSPPFITHRRQHRPLAVAAAVATAVPPEPVTGGTGGEEDVWAPRAVYVHLPFCRRRCYYCDFPIKVVGDRPGAADEASDEYVQLLLRELAATLPTKQQPQQQGGSSSGSSQGIDPQRIRAAGGLTSIFFGGGTPSLTPPRLVKEVMAALEGAFGLAAEGCEISMEMDPGTFDLPRLQAFLHDCGVTRVSMGVQAFDASLLAACGRAHSLQDVHAAVATLKAAGFENWSVDLIGGLPGQTLAQWEASVDAAIASGAAHVSVYDLQVEAGTAFGKWYGANNNDDDHDDDNDNNIAPPSAPITTTTRRVTPLPREELAAEMYALASRKLRAAGFKHYELSNYAKPGHECQHNRVYWEGLPFLALGMGAASYLGWHRFTRPRSMGEYRLWVALLEDRGWREVSGYDAAKAEWAPQQWAVERVEDLLMVGLRLKEGVSLPRLVARSGLPQAVGEERAAAVLREWEKEVVPRFVERGAAVLEEEEGGRRLVLTDPEGLLVSNEVISELYAAVARVLEGDDAKEEGV